MSGPTWPSLSRRRLTCTSIASGRASSAPRTRFTSSARVAGEEVEELVLGRRERDRLAVHARAALVGVDLEAAEPYDPVERGLARPPQDGPEAGEERPLAAGRHDEIVRARVEGLLHVALAGRGDDDHDALRLRVGPESAACVEG